MQYDKSSNYCYLLSVKGMSKVEFCNTKVLVKEDLYRNLIFR